MAVWRRFVEGLIFKVAKWAPFELLDQARRGQGRLFDVLGLGPIESPSRVALSTAAMTLRAYTDSTHKGPVVLIIPAPIKRAYIWDLLPAGRRWAEPLLQSLPRCILV